ncbi:MAG: DUF4255 domain-containing protein [Massilia sp.]
MSNSLAIAAATATLRSVLLEQIIDLDPSLSDLDVTTQPPDLARKGNLKPQLNVFLYHTAFNAGWRNMDLPNQASGGERGLPPLALNLYYMITAYARDDNDSSDPSSHRVLCCAMSVLHDYPLLKKTDIEAALPDSDLARQLERIRIAPQPLSVDEIYKLWTAYQAPYRISAAYELTVALVDSRQAARSAPPVLNRGAGDQGVFTRAGRAPALSAWRAPNRQAAARLGEEIVVTGENLRTAGAIARFEGLRFGAAIELAPQAGAEPNQLVIHLPASGAAPNDPHAWTRWAPGFYSLALVTTLPDTPEFSSNQLGFALAPVITVSPASVAAGSFTLTVTCTPQLRGGQQVRLLFGERQVAPHSITAAPDESHPTTLAFQLAGVPPGAWLVRLRVDGVDSIPVVFSGTPPVAAFDPAQQVTVLP